VKHPCYYALRAETVGFLNDQRRARQQRLKPAAPIAANGLEKINLAVGFIPLTDCAPLVVAQEKGFFQRHGLEQVELRREANWKTLETHVRQGVLDAAQMVAGMPYAMTLGFRGQEPLPMATALTLSRNGNAITLHRRFLEAGVRDVTGLKRWLNDNPGVRPVFAMVHPASMHNLILRAWLASGGIDPDRDVDLIVIPPPQMVATLRAGTIDGYCVGEPWNSRAVREGIGTVIATDPELWNGHCEKVLGVRQDWATAHPRSHEALVSALLEACQWCDRPENREELTELLADGRYVGTDAAVLRPALVGPFDRGRGAAEPEPDMLRFHSGGTNTPDREDGVWILAQLARWGLCPFPDDWERVIDRVQQRDLYLRVAQASGSAEALGDPVPSPIRLFGNDCLDPHDPLAYLRVHAGAGAGLPR
jgi:nitrate/nitrite transport system ATP-binding protein